MKENGGIRPDDPQVSDLRASLDKATFTVLNKKDGLSLDEMTIRVQEAGYFLDKSDLDYGIDGATPRDLLDLIDRESRGEVLYSRDQETQFRDYERSQKNLEELDRLGVDPRNMTEEELSQALEIAIEQDIMAQDVRLSESMEQTSDLTAQEFDNAKIEAVENDYNMGNFKQEYNDMVEMNAGIDDTFNLQTREAEIDAEIETLEFDAENTSNAANIDADDLAAFDENIRIADDLIARSDESFDTATNAAASCIMRNTK
jgi:vacuolar-type H+-ATPase subunit I/STV1